MSGGAVLNGCGYVGMTHAKTSGEVNFALIISAADIMHFIDLHLNELPKLAHCNQSILVPPVAPLANCAAKRPLEFTINPSQL
jgi:hypothetical protein